MRSKLADWEKAQVDSITVRMLGAATVGTALAAALAYFLGLLQVGKINPELLFIPWGIALVFGISEAFHQGVMAERARQQAGLKDKDSKVAISVEKTAASPSGN